MSIHYSHHHFRHIIGFVLLIAPLFIVGKCYADDIQFNTDVLDIKDRQNIDLNNFSHENYIMPGNYTFKIKINSRELPEQPVDYLLSEADQKQSVPCITQDLLDKFGLKPGLQKELVWWHSGQCLKTESLKGMTAKGELGTEFLVIAIPQAYLEYTSDDWDPPSQWDNGIAGVLFDYNLNSQFQRQQEGNKSTSISGNGTVGANLGAWRMRVDWQGRYNNADDFGSSQSLDASRYYAYRALPHLGAKLSLGEDYLHSDIFDSFRFAGASIITDDSMLPPNLRGYAPEVTGTARTNAKVTISQQGRVLYEEQVAAGPFRIQDINNSVSGKLDVRVEEADGSVQTYQMDTASIPYLTRPGHVRYKLAIGRPTDDNHSVDGSVFATSEATWGVSNGWSLYGGGVGSDGYDALALGLGRDLLVLGAISFDVTASQAQIPQEDTLSGKSYRISYSKNFDEYNSQVTFAGYRFSEKNYMSMSQYLDALHYSDRLDSNKEMYTVTFNKQFIDSGLSVYLDYNHQTYWDAPRQDRYNLTMSKYFDFNQFRGVSISLSAYRNDNNDTTENGMYASLSVPWGNSGTISYSGSIDHGENIQQASYYDRLGNNDTYQISAGVGRSGETASGNISHQGDIAQVDFNGSYQQSRYSAVGMNIQGGATATLKGAALHRTSVAGGTRVMLDTDSIADIPVHGYGPVVRTNHFGKAVVSDINSYSRNSLSIDLNTLPDNAEAVRSVVDATFTEGAIGYRQFSVISGEKALAVIRLTDGSVPPFGATVNNMKLQEVGIVNDEGSVYLNGINSGEHMTVQWDGEAQCEFVLPENYHGGESTHLLLPCQAITQHATAAKTQ